MIKLKSRNYRTSNRYIPYGYPKILLLIITLAVLQGLATGAQNFGASPVDLEKPAGIENFGKLNDNYYRGSQPNEGEFAELKRLGVKTIVDLRKDSVDEATEWANEAGLNYINIPLTTKRAATEDQTTYFLKVVNDPANWPVFVHCKGGRHRTGEMSAIYRITQERWTADKAYEEMKKYDFKNNIFYPRALKKYVFAYYDSFKSQQTSTSPAITTAHKSADESKALTASP